MALSLTQRIVKGSPLTPAEMDKNLDDIETLVNALEAAMGVALNADGTLKAGAVDGASKIVNAIITLAKLAVTTANTVLVANGSGVITPLTGTALQVMRWGAGGVLEAVDVSSILTDNSGLWMYDNPELKVTETVTQAAWQTLDLSADIVALGATTPVAAILQAECYMPQKTSDTSDLDATVLLRVTSNNGTSTGSTNTHRCNARTSGVNTSPDGRPSEASGCQMIVKLDGTNIYWNTAFTNNPVGSSAKIWVVGFVLL